MSGNVEKQRTFSAPLKEELSMFPCDKDLTEILFSSSLLKKLEELKQALVKNHDAVKTESCNVNPLDPIPLGNQSLIPADLGNLPPHHFVIYRFGCYVVRLLCSSCGHSPLTLLLADSISTEVRSRCQNILYKNSFYYDANNRILYIKSTWLNNAGEFIVSILHTMAHIKAGIQINDGHPIFTEEFEHGVAVLGTTLFLMCCNTTDNGIEESKDTTVMDSENWNNAKQLPCVQSIFEDLIHIKVPPETKFIEETLHDRLKKYTLFKIHNMLQQILDTSGKSRKFSVLEGRRAATVHPETDSEDKDEGFAEYNMQEPEDKCESLSEDFHNLLKNLSQTRDMLSMLHLQRRCVLNRLKELESELAGLHSTGKQTIQNLKPENRSTIRK
ncbi:uncharacterized protein LOC125467021 [Stegostoma tigrinum]|uniref:uncharacterized protein LOC125467021 n=1 Tax=Stegostoma tigrinum TaxID=3053191 RepID=UPI00286FBF90|nr:uncharacterized protein LOC125467021 [Stegostoma tigrinum]